MDNRDYLDILKEQRLLKNKGRVYHEQKVPDSLRSKIMDFFKKNPYPKDSVVHAFAEKNQISPDVMETSIYSILSDYLKIGKHQNKPDSAFDSHELKKGVEIEKEHTDMPEVAKEIARDHLSEFSDYYTRLEKMEEEAKKYWKK